MDEKESILIVDDDENTCRILSLFFGKKGYKVETAKTGREALDKVRSRFFNVAIMDIRLPDMKGTELLAPLNRMHPDMAMIMITAYASLETAVQALNEGASAYITKPLHMHDVLVTISKTLEKQHLVIENRRLYEEAQREIAERKRAEEVLRESEERYRTLFESATEGILIADLATRELKYANPAISRMVGYSTEELKEKCLSDIYQRDSLEYIVSEIEAQARGEKALSRNIPCLRKDGRIIYADINIVKTIMDGRECNIVFFSDVTARKLAEEQRKKSAEKLLKAMQETIRAMVITIEMRDPYTAGHQWRVASLATSIAVEMGLSKDRIQGIHMAGIIHDVGKIYVPAEILSKPGRLNEIEFSMIKRHCQVGYDILKNIEFPWPIAQMVLQHHERMDGSGYPQGLLGKDILLEARILAVADVVEAMASHRPYRAALGIDKALEEISQNRGVLYDPEVVDVCLKLLIEKGFKFEPEAQTTPLLPKLFLGTVTVPLRCSG
jgi:PAS domain S-box-containing protein